jgi:hypothetical protein
VGVFVSVRV